MNRSKYLEIYLSILQRKQIMRLAYNPTSKLESKVLYVKLNQNYQKIFTRNSILQDQHRVSSMEMQRFGNSHLMMLMTYL